MSTLSYQEKSLYGTLTADLIVYTPYFVRVLHHIATFTDITGTILLLTVVQIVLQSIIAIASRSRITDERDRQIAAAGYRNAYFTLVSMLVIGMGMLWIPGTGLLDPSQIGMHFLTVFLGMVVLSEIVKIATQLVAYRRTI